MSRKNHAPGAGGGKEKGRSAGDQQTDGVAGGKLGGSGSVRGHTDASNRSDEAGRKGGQHATMGKGRQHQQTSDDTSGE